MVGHNCIPEVLQTYIHTYIQTYTNIYRYAKLNATEIGCLASRLAISGVYGNLHCIYYITLHYHGILQLALYKYTLRLSHKLGALCLYNVWWTLFGIVNTLHTNFCSMNTS